MESKKWYSPKLERELVHLLYLEARKRRIPMTRLANELIRATLLPKKAPSPGRKSAGNINLKATLLAPDQRLS